MGMVQDMKSRQTRVRVDDEQRQRKVNRARSFIYYSRSRVTVNSAGIERMLKPKSWVPTKVSAFASCIPDR